MSKEIQFELSMPSDPARIREVRVQIEQFAAAQGFPSKDWEAIGLCVNEALANVIRHGYGGVKDRPIEISAGMEGEGLRVEIRDWGKTFDPANIEPKPVDAPGGLGLVCLKQMMDEIRFTRLPDGMRLEMIKRRSAAEKTS